MYLTWQYVPTGGLTGVQICINISDHNTDCLNETEMLSTLLAICEGNPLITTRFLLREHWVIPTFNVFLIINWNKLSTSSCRWFEMSQATGLDA